MLHPPFCLPTETVGQDKPFELGRDDFFVVRIYNIVTWQHKRAQRGEVLRNTVHRASIIGPAGRRRAEVVGQFEYCEFVAEEREERA